MLGAVIFDFDGVITDSEILHLQAFNRALAPYGTQISRQDYYKHYLGLTDVELLKQLAEHGHIKPASIEKLARDKKHIFESLVRTKADIIDGVRDLLFRLRQANVPMAICSGALAAEIELVLENARLRDFFAVIVSAEQVPRGKPAPDGFLLTLEKLNRSGFGPLTADRCVVIEDSHWGIDAARAAGMHTVAVTNSYPPDQLADAEIIIDRLDHLTIEQLHELCA